MSAEHAPVVTPLYTLLHGDSVHALAALAHALEQDEVLAEVAPQLVPAADRVERRAAQHAGA